MSKLNRKNKSKSKYSAPALEKGLTIIEFLSGRNEGESLSSIGNGIGKSNTEIFRMISVLEDQGYVERMLERDKFRLTDKLFNLSLKQTNKKNLINLAIPAMERFARECQNSCHLSVRKGNEIVVVLRVDSPDNVCVVVPIGHHLPIVNSPSGHCMVAYSHPDQIQSDVAEIKRSKGAAAARKFKNLLQKIRENGYLIMRDGFAKGVVGISAPLIDLEQKTCVGAMTSPVLHLLNLKDEDLYRIASRLKYYADVVTKNYNNLPVLPENVAAGMHLHGSD